MSLLKNTTYQCLVFSVCQNLDCARTPITSAYRCVCVVQVCMCRTGEYVSYRCESVVQVCVCCTGVCQYLDCARTPITSAYKSATMLMLAALGFGALLSHITDTHTSTDRQIDILANTHRQTQADSHTDTQKYSQTLTRIQPSVGAHHLVQTCASS